MKKTMIGTVACVYEKRNAFELKVFSNSFFEIAFGLYSLETMKLYEYKEVELVINITLNQHGAKQYKLLKIVRECQ